MILSIITTILLLICMIIHYRLKKYKWALWCAVFLGFSFNTLLIIILS